MGAEAGAGAFDRAVVIQRAARAGDPDAVVTGDQRTRRAARAVDQAAAGGGQVDAVAERARRLDRAVIDDRAGAAVDVNSVAAAGE